jgi:drug/metabolite transporter superfamily protein YnfA
MREKRWFWVLVITVYAFVSIFAILFTPIHDNAAFGGAFLIFTLIVGLVLTRERR